MRLERAWVTNVLHAVSESEKYDDSGKQSAEKPRHSKFSCGPEYSTGSCDESQNFYQPNRMLWERNTANGNNLQAILVRTANHTQGGSTMREAIVTSHFCGELS